MFTKITFMRLIILCLAVAGVGLGTVRAHADEFTAWHNGSRMTVVIDGSYVEIRYDRPKSGLRKHGVRSGTVLFTGELRGRNMEGEAKVFRQGCAPEQYWVSGRYSSAMRRFALRGEAPRRESGGCDVVDYTSSGSNARLQFTKSGGGRGDDDDEGDHDDLPGDGSVCGWYAIYSCHESRRAAVRDINRAGYGGVINTRDVPNFRNGFYCVVDGPISKGNAQRRVNRSRRHFDSPYIKNGC